MPARRHRSRAPRGEAGEPECASIPGGHDAGEAEAPLDPPTPREGDLDELLVRAQRVSADYPGDAKIAELAALVGKAASLAD